MYQISELARQVGLSRTTLLYYEKLGLLRGKRLKNGYRVYSDKDAQQLRLVQQLHLGGLTLKECKACLEARINRQDLHQRLSQLDREIAEKQKARDLLASLLGETGQKEWHETIQEVAPEAHLDWLIQQGFNEKEAIRLQWLSKDMNEHEQYMADFMRIYGAVDRWAPGSEEDTLKALEKVPFSPEKILDIGCGKGVSTTLLAQHCQAEITAVDNEASALARLSERAQVAGVADKITPLCASMTDLPFPAASFDLLWAEGSAYIMGVRNALSEWKTLLKDGGMLVFSDLVWLTPTPSEQASGFWQKEYPDMTTAAERIKQAEACGYSVLDSFSLSKAASDAYYGPLQQQVDALRDKMQGSAALADLDAELRAYQESADEFGYQMFLLRKN